MRANAERAPVAPIKRIITKIRVATAKRSRNAVRATEKRRSRNILRIIKETRSLCKRFFGFFPKTGEESRRILLEMRKSEEFEERSDFNKDNGRAGRAHNERKNRDESRIIGARRVETN